MQSPTPRGKVGGGPQMEEHSFREKPSGAPGEKGEAATQTNGSASPEARRVSSGVSNTESFQ